MATLKKADLEKKKFKRFVSMTQDKSKIKTYEEKAMQFVAIGKAV